MDWISEHALQIIVAIAAAIAAWLNNRQKEKDGEPADYDGDGAPDNRPGTFQPQQMDMEEADRTRRLQEEIRRKIAERRGGGAAQPPPSPLHAPRPAAEELPEILRRRLEELAGPSPQEIEARRAAERLSRQRREAEEAQALEEQRLLEARMRALEAQRAEARRRAAEVTSAAAATLARGGGGVPSAAHLLRDLRHPATVRRAFVLREVLGPPPGLR